MILACDEYIVCPSFFFVCAPTNDFFNKKIVTSFLEKKKLSFMKAAAFARKKINPNPNP